jgi:hypothetical protein
MPAVAGRVAKAVGLVKAEEAAIASRIRFIRGQRVMLDSDLAFLYGVQTKRLNEQVRRNPERFPADFMFRLTKAEAVALRSQIATLDPRRGSHRKYLPHAFTEHGALMAANVLNSPRAVEASVFVVRAFVQLRRMLSSHRELAERLAELEQRVQGHDHALRALVASIRALMNPAPEPSRPRMGFRTKPVG